MSIRYCTSCGHRHSFSFEQPQFCESCGKSFNLEVSKVSTPQVVQAPQSAANAFAQRYFGEEDDTPLPNISRLDVSVEVPQNQKVTVGSAKDAAMLGGARPAGTQFNFKDVKQDLDQKFARDRDSTKEEITPG